MSDRQPRRPWGLIAIASFAGALIAIVMGFLAFGAQATAAPDHVPVAVAAPESGPLRIAAERVAGQGGEQLAWRLTTPEQARQLLADKEIYGALELGVGPAGPTATVLVSGAVNPSGTQVAQQALTGAGQALTAALAQTSPAGTAPTVRVETLYPAGSAGRAAPLAISALAWVGCMAAGALLVVQAGRAKTALSPAGRLTQVLGTSVLVTAVLVGFLWLWDDALPLDGRVVGFIALVSVAFAAVQAGLLRLLGIRAMAILGPLYLLAPAVAGQVPELLNPAYRSLLWSWTPFRFSTEGLRSLLQGTPGAPDVATALWVLASMLAAGLIVVLWPGRSASQEAEADAPDGVVHVGVH